MNQDKGEIIPLGFAVLSLFGSVGGADSLPVSKIEL
jgi:hypothetical protein